MRRKKSYGHWPYLSFLAANQKRQDSSFECLQVWWAMIGFWSEWFWVSFLCFRPKLLSTNLVLCAATNMETHSLLAGSGWQKEKKNWLEDFLEAISFERITGSGLQGKLQGVTRLIQNLPKFAFSCGELKNEKSWYFFQYWRHSRCVAKRIEKSEKERH